MKRILIQLDTDGHPSPFDAIAAYDAGVDVVIPYPGVEADGIADVVQGAMFPLTRISRVSPTRVSLVVSFA